MGYVILTCIRIKKTLIKNETYIDKYYCIRLIWSLYFVRFQYFGLLSVIPRTFSLNCFVPTDVTCPEQGVNPLSELICVCAANGVRPGTLYLDIPDANNVQQNESIENGDLFDLRLKATVPVTDSMAEVTCSVEGYNTNEPIPPELITTTFIICKLIIIDFYCLKNLMTLYQIY